MSTQLYQKTMRAASLAAFLEQFQQATGMGISQMLGKVTHLDPPAVSLLPQVELESGLLEVAP